MWIHNKITVHETYKAAGITKKNNRKAFMIASMPH